jgi:hypothetical protein
MIGSVQTEGKDAMIRNEVTKKADQYGGDDVASRVERPITSLAVIKQLIVPRSRAKRHRWPDRKWVFLAKTPKR